MAIISSYTGETNKGTSGGTYAITNLSATNYILDYTDESATEHALALLGTLIADLIKQGIIKGSVATA